jgi:hypothetical protein
MGDMKNAHNILVGKSEGRRPLERTRPRYEDNIRMYFRDIGWEGVDWMHLAQDRDQFRAVVSTVMDFWFL